MCSDERLRQAGTAAGLQEGAMVELQWVQAFIDAAGRCRHHDDLRSLMDDITRRLRFDHFALVHHVDLRGSGTDEAIALWSYPATWVDEYLERRLATSDPVHLASHRTNVGFAWDDLPRLITMTPEHRRVREQTRKAGIVDGYTVPANIPGEANGSCSFAVGRGSALPRESLPAAQLVGSFAFHAARLLAQRRFRLPPPQPRLSPRQLDCLILIGRGLTDREAARQLCLAEDTVTEYLDDARQRFQVRKRTQLVLRAIFTGQIALSDVLCVQSPL